MAHRLPENKKSAHESFYELRGARLASGVIGDAATCATIIELGSKKDGDEPSLLEALEQESRALRVVGHRLYPDEPLPPPLPRGRPPTDDALWSRYVLRRHELTARELAIVALAVGVEPPFRLTADRREEWEADTIRKWESLHSRHRPKS